MPSTLRKACCSVLLLSVLPVASYADNAFSGFQAGVAIGADDATMDWKTTRIVEPVTPYETIPPSNKTTESLDDSAFSYGIFGGYNWSIGQDWIMGVELAFHDSDLSDSLERGIPGMPPSSTTTDVDVNASYLLGLKTGFLISPSTLAYSTISATQTEIETSTFCPSDGVICNPGSPAKRFSDDDKASGWAIGIGLEKALAGNITIRAEYRYADLGTAELSPVPMEDDESYGIDADVDVTRQTLQIGAAYTF
jgi:outer membrane immunogenic protein